MVPFVKKFGLIAVIFLVAIFAVFALLQFTRVSAAEAPEARGAGPASSPQQVDVGLPGAGPWLLVANMVTSNLSIVNTANGVVYGPFLQGQLGTDGGGRFDIAVTPDGRTALISNFGDGAVFFVNVSDPIHPSLITSVTIPFFAEDIDISPDGKYALVTDGGFSNQVAAINILSATQVITAQLGNAQAQAVEIAPDGTVILADYWNQAVHSIRLDDMLGGITSTQTYTVPYPGVALTDTAGLPRPVNVGIAPDGQTVIVCSAISGTVDIYRIIAPGVLTFTRVITGLEGAFSEMRDSFNPGVQSVAFNAAGTKAYAVINGYYKNDITGTNAGDRLAVLNITGPGQVSLAVGGVVTLPHHTGSQFFGVDTVAVAGNKAYLGYPTSSTSDDPTSLAIVDLTDYSVTSTMVLSHEVSYPVGVAVVPIRVYLPVILR
jgi:hypothetical protein